MARGSGPPKIRPTYQVTLNLKKFRGKHAFARVQVCIPRAPSWCRTRGSLIDDSGAILGRAMTVETVQYGANVVEQGVVIWLQVACTSNKGVAYLLRKK